MTSLPTGATAVTPSPAQVAPADLGRAAAAALVVGAALGTWCRAWTQGAGGVVGAVLADLGGPWVLAAFVTGVAVAGRHRAAAALERASGLLAGVVAGGGALVVASFVYYDGSTAPHAVAWMAVGIVVGGLAGGAGAAWALWRTSAAGATAATVLGVVLAAEAVARFAGTLSMGSTATAYLTVLGLAGLGVLTPLVLTRGSALGVAGSVGVLALAVPTAALVAFAPALLALPAAL